MVKNVLIISMSTMRKNSKQYYYYVKDGEVDKTFYCGKYSMEPGTKHILNKLSKDKVISINEIKINISTTLPITLISLVDAYNNVPKKTITISKVGVVCNK